MGPQAEASASADIVATATQETHQLLEICAIFSAHELLIVRIHLILVVVLVILLLAVRICSPSPACTGRWRDRSSRLLCASCTLLTRALLLLLLLDLILLLLRQTEDLSRRFRVELALCVSVTTTALQLQLFTQDTQRESELSRTSGSSFAAFLCLSFTLLPGADSRPEVSVRS